MLQSIHHANMPFLFVYRMSFNKSPKVKMTSISQHGAISDEWVHLEDEFPQTPRMEYEAVLMPSSTTPARKKRVSKKKKRATPVPASTSTSESEGVVPPTPLPHRRRRRKASRIVPKIKDSQSSGRVSLNTFLYDTVVF